MKLPHSRRRGAQSRTESDPGSCRDQKPLLLVALGTALALGVAALAEEPMRIATWRGGSLERADYERWRTLHQLDDGPEAIREMVLVASLAADSRERGVSRGLRTRLELEAMRQQVLVPALRRHAEAAVTVRDAEVEALRRQHPEAFRRPRKLRLRNIYKRLQDETTRTRMEEIRRRLVDGGADFEQLARRESESQTRFRGGSLGFLAPEKLPPEVAAAVRDLTPGRISDVVEHGTGLTIFLCEEVRQAQAPTPDEVRAKLRTNLLRLRRREEWDRFQQRLLSGSAPRLQPTSDATVLDMEGYRLSAEALAGLVALQRPEKQLSGLAVPEIEQLLRGWALGVLGVRRAVELGLDRNPETAAALRWRRLEILARRELDRRVDERLREPGEEDLRRRFDADRRRYREPESYELAVIHFGIDQDPRRRVAEAVDVARRLEAGELTFEAAARRYSTHPSAADGGLIGWRDRRQIAASGPVAVNAIRQLSPGDRSGLLRLDSGLWIFELRARRDERPMTFEAAKDRIRNELRRRQIRELRSAVWEEQLSKIGLTIRNY